MCRCTFNIVGVSRTSSKYCKRDDTSSTSALTKLEPPRSRNPLSTMEASVKDCPKLHEPLDPERREIRLLRMNRQSADVLHLQTVSLADHPLFVALSYVWGDATPTQEIVANGHLFRIRMNLATFLERWTHTELPPSLQEAWDGHNQSHNQELPPIWIDALCINQDDVNERSQQVQLMGAVYRSAQWIFSFLDPDRDGKVELGLQRIAWAAEQVAVELETLKKRDQTLDDAAPAWNFEWMAEAGFGDLQQGMDWLGSVEHTERHEYFLRVWAVQEMALAREDRGVFLCGNTMVSYAPITGVAYYFFLLRKYRPQRPSWVEPAVWVYIMNSASFRFRRLIVVGHLQLVGHLQHSSQDSSQGLSWTQPTAATVWNLAGQYKSTDPRDQVFGLAALAGNRILPDYSKAVKEVYVEWFLQRTEHLRVLNPIARAGIGSRADNPSQLPSWLEDLGDWSKDGHGLLSTTRGRRGEALASFTLPEPTVKEAVLHVHGARLDTILDDAQSRAAPSLVNFLLGKLPEYRDQVVQCPSGKLPMVQVLLRTMFLDTQPSPVRPLDFSLYETHELLKATIVFLLAPHIVELISSDEDFYTVNVFPELSIGPPEAMPEGSRHTDPGFMTTTNSLLVLHFHQLKFGTKTIFFRTEEGYFGIGPSALQPGDVICALDRVEQTVMLRNVEGKTMLVGPCFVLAYSGDEMKEWLKNRQLETEEFKIW